jgi:hypothetical protein
VFSSLLKGLFHPVSPGVRQSVKIAAMPMGRGRTVLVPTHAVRDIHTKGD